MTRTLAVAGKGGVGKTTLSALAVRWLAQSGCGPTLVVDADPNSNLHESLGVALTDTVGNIREAMKSRKGVPEGLSQDGFVDYKINTSLVETDGYDFLAMGRPEGPGCYCYPNSVLKRAIDRLSRSYACLVLDNEAGLENVSRRLMQQVDLLLLVSDATIKGIRTAGHIRRLAEDLEGLARRFLLVVNRADGASIPPPLAAEIDSQGLELAGVLPRDPAVQRLDEQGRSVFDLPADSPVCQAAFALFARLVTVCR